jgi:uncharacterized protein YceH (UPF0502 family)
MHLLCGEVSVSDAPSPDASAGASHSLSEFEALKADHKRLAQEVTELRAMVEHMASELGIALDKPSQT